MKPTGGRHDATSRPDLYSRVTNAIIADLETGVRPWSKPWSADINRNYVGLLEREEHAATVDMLEKLAAVLEIDPAAFFARG